MEEFSFIAGVLVALVVSTFVGQKVKQVPLALFQIFAGLLLALVPYFSNFELQPQMFMFLVISPLLFFEGLETSSSLIRKNFKSIISLAGITAIITILAIGYSTKLFLNWPLPILIALAAIVTPTDATALGSISNKYDFPEKIGKSLNLESLFNDATGLVILELALIAMETGKFSLIGGSEKFFIVALGGVLVGLILGWLIMILRQTLLRLNFDRMAGHAIINILTPFLIYFIAESIQVSGIIAVVTAGIVHNIERERVKYMSAQLNVFIDNMWRLLTDILNGFVFIILGLILPKIFKYLLDISLWQVFAIIGLAIFIYLIMLVVRFLSIFKDGGKFNRNTANLRLLKNALVFSISGIHGTVTMAMALSLPVTLVNGQSLPHREALIAVAAILVLVSLAVPTLTLPSLLSTKMTEYSDKEYKATKELMTDTGVLFVEAADEFSIDVRNHVLSKLQDQLGYGSGAQGDVYREEIAELNRVQNKAVTLAMTRNKFSKGVTDFYKKTMKKSKNHQNRSGIIGSPAWNGLINRLKKEDTKQRKEKSLETLIGTVNQIQEIVIPEALNYIDELDNRSHDKRVVATLKDYLSSEHSLVANKIDDQQVTVLFLLALVREQEFVQNLLQREDISPKLAFRLIREVTATQTLLLDK